MPKKSTKSRTVRFRCTEEDYAALTEAMERNRFDNMSAWILWTLRLELEARPAKVKSLTAYDEARHLRYFVTPELPESNRRKYIRRANLNCDHCCREVAALNERNLCTKCQQIELELGPDPTSEEIWNILTKQI